MHIVIPFLRVLEFVISLSSRLFCRNCGSDFVMVNFVLENIGQWLSAGSAISDWRKLVRRIGRVGATSNAQF
jgi:hypothetical protein